MNLLLIDIGNTNVVCAMMDNDKVLESIRLESDMNFFNVSLSKYRFIIYFVYLLNSIIANENALETAAWVACEV